MTRSLLFIALYISCFSVSIGQVKEGNLWVRNPYPYYVLSTDGKTLGINETNDNQQRWYNFIDLATFAWHPKGSVSTKSTFLTPDLKSAYSAELNLKGFKGGGGWLAYDKYMSWYYPSSTATDVIQWPDRNFIIAVRSDGKLLTAGSFKFKKEKWLMDPITTIYDLNITDPLTGKTVSTIRKGEIMQMSYEWWQTRQPRLIDNDNLLVWYFTINWTSYNLSTGKLTSINPPEYLQALSGKYGMGVVFKDGRIGSMKYRKVVMNMETGKMVHDEMVNTVDKWGYWIAEGPHNSFYTFKALTGELCKEEIIDDKLVLTKTIKLDVSDIDSTGNWGSVDHSTFRLMVSEPAGIVLLLPPSSNLLNKYSNMLLAFSLSDGKMMYKNPDFVRPSDSYLARERANAEAFTKRMNFNPEELPLNALLRTRDGYHVLLSHQSGSSQWAANKFIRNSDGSYTPTPVTLYANDLKNMSCEVVSNTVCQRCHGQGRMTTYEQRTTEQVDKMIYTQITTTRTQNVATTGTCDVCHGVGFAH